MIVSFKLYVMNFLEIVINCYSHITSHVSQVFASCTHYTSYSLLNVIHVIVCDFVLAIQDWKFLDFDKMCLKFEIWGKIDWKSCFWKIWVKYKCFWKTLHLILMHSIHKILCFEEFLHKIALFFKILVFPNFWSIECDFRSIEKFQNFQV